MKTTRVTFRPNTRRVTAESGMTQWDYGQMLEISGLDLPEAFEVDFSLDPMNGISETAIGTNGTVRVPDTFLEQSDTIYAFIFLHEEQDDGETRYRITIPMEKRPARGVAVPDPVEQSVIDQTIAALQYSAAKAEENAEAAEAAKEAVMNLGVEAEDGGPDEPASVHKTVDEETGEVTLLFRLRQGEKGEQGNKGDTGARYTPTVSGDGVLSWTNNGDLENPDPFNVVDAVLAALPAAEEARF